MLVSLFTTTTPQLSASPDGDMGMWSGFVTLVVQQYVVNKQVTLEFGEVVHLPIIIFVSTLHVAPFTITASPANTTTAAPHRLISGVVAHEAACSTGGDW